MAVEIGRIESEVILSRMQQTKEKIILQYIQSRFRVIVEHIMGTRLIVRRVVPSDEMLLAGRAVQLFFKYHEEDMTMLPRVVHDRGEQIELMIENPAYRDISRTFERVYHASSISVVVIDNPEITIPKYPNTMRIVEQKEEHEHVDGLSANLSDLVRSYFEVSKKQNAIAKIVLFREHPPEHTLERLSAYIGYPLIIPYPDSETGELPIPSRVSVEDAMRKMNILPPNIMSTERVRIPGFESKSVQIIVPIIYLSHCVGYVFMATSRLRMPQYASCIQLMERYSRTLSAVLDKNGYFADLVRFRDQARAVRLINISATGLRFSYKSLQHVYEADSSLQMMISFPWDGAQHDFLVDARIVHIDAYDKLHYASVEFHNPDPALFMLIRKYLYKNESATEE